MKYIIAALLCAQIAAFTTVSPANRAGTQLAAEYEKMDGESKINLKVSLQNKSNNLLCIPRLYRRSNR